MIGNDTSEGEEVFNNGLFVPTPAPTVINRARNQESDQRSFQGNPSQNRGQDFRQPPASPPPATRTPQLVVEQASFEEASPASFSRFQPQAAAPAPVQQRPQPAPVAAAPPRPQPAQAFEAAPRPQPQPAQAFEAAPRPRPQPAVVPQQAQAAFEAPVQVQASFSQDVQFEERPQLTSVPANAVPARGFEPENAVAPQQPFTAFAQNPQPVRQGRLPAESAEFPEAVRSQQNGFRPAPAEEAAPVEAPEAPKPAFNPNRARSNSRPQQNQLRTRPQAEAPQEAPARTRFQAEPAPTRAPARPQPEPSAQPSRQAAPAHRQALPGGQLPQSSGGNDFTDRDGEQFHAPVESSGPPPQFESFPILGSAGGRSQPTQNFRPQPAVAQQAFQPQPAPAVESFRPVEEPQPQAAPVRIRQRPQEDQFQFQPSFQAQQPVQDIQFEQNFQQPSGKFENLVQEFTGARGRSGRAEFQEFQHQPVFKFNPVPAVPDL